MKRIKAALKKENLFQSSFGLEESADLDETSLPSTRRTRKINSKATLSGGTQAATHDWEFVSKRQKKRDPSPRSSRPSSPPPLDQPHNVLRGSSQRTSENLPQNVHSVSPYAPFGSNQSRYITGNTFIPDEELLSGALSAKNGLADQPSDEWLSYSTARSERRRRRESHNIAERRRRDAVNESIRDLSNLIPSYHRKEDSKRDILEASVKWTRDLMWAHHLKLKREADMDNIINFHEGPLPDLRPSTPGERAIDREIQSLLTENNITSFSSSDRDPYHTRRASEPMPKHTIDDATAQVYRPQRHLRKATSRGSIISYVASVHSVTSLTYRSPTGDVRTETYGHKSTVSYFPDEKDPVISNSDEHVLGPTDDTVLQNAPDGRELRDFPPVFPDIKSADAASSKSGGNKPTLESELTPDIVLDSNKSRSSAGLDERAEEPVQQSRSTNVDFIEYEFFGPSEQPVSRSRDTAVGNLHLDHSYQPEDASDVALKPKTGGKQTEVSHHQDQAVKEGSSTSLDNLNLDKDIGGLKLDNGRSISGAGYTVTYLENGLVRLRWRCVCEHPFQVDVLEHQKDAAIKTIGELAHDASDIERRVTVQYPLLGFLKLSQRIWTLFYSPRQQGNSLPQTIISTGAKDLVRAPREAPNQEPDRYICVCFPGITYKKYLHHVDVNKAADDPQLFSALQKTYYDWKPLWRRLLTLRSLARVEYFEFKVFYSNLVTIKDDWRDRFPQGHGPNEWSYIPTSRDMTPYLIDDVLTHYVHNPECVKLGNYFWKRIPKKLFCQLECPNDKPFKVGWGLYFIEDFSQLYLMLILVPVLVGGVAVAAWYCAHYGKSFADGATVASGFAAVVMYMFSVAQGWAKQKGNL